MTTGTSRRVALAALGLAVFGVGVLSLHGCAAFRTDEEVDPETIIIEVHNTAVPAAEMHIVIGRVGGRGQQLGKVPATETTAFYFTMRRPGGHRLRATRTVPGLGTGAGSVVSDGFLIPSGTARVVWDLRSNFVRVE